MKGRLSRLVAAGGALDRDQRFVAAAALALLGTMFLPWYEKTALIPSTRAFASDKISAFGDVSFVEAAIFLVSVGVLLLVLARAEGGRFHLPGGDGTVIFAAGLWASALIFYRVFDRPDAEGIAGTVGIQWGFFVAFVAAGALAFAGQQMRAADRPQKTLRQRRPRPPSVADRGDFDDLDDAGTEVVHVPAAPPEVARRESRRPRERAVSREDAEDLTFEAPDIGEPPARLPKPHGRSSNEER